MIIKNTVNFALLMQDDFNGTIQSGPGYRFIVNGRVFIPLCKPEGFMVFSGLKGTSFEVAVSGTKYRTAKIKIDTTKLDTLLPVVRVRLFRRAGAHFPDSEWLLGSGSNGDSLLLLPAPESLSLSLRTLEKTEEGKSKIGLQGYSIRNLEGLRFMIGTKATCETFIITRKLDEGQYLLDRKLRSNHKEGDLVVRAFATISEEDGSYSIPVEAGFNSKTVTIHNLGKEAM